MNILTFPLSHLPIIQGEGLYKVQARGPPEVVEDGEDIVAAVVAKHDGDGGGHHADYS